jgi:PAS domain S-box-containing protein
VAASEIRVVLVDDAPEVRSLLRMRLRVAGGFEVVGEAGTGVEALEVVGEQRPDLVLLDVSMPDMDGLDALTRIRESAPDTCVVMFSGFEEQGLADRARELGAADFISKAVPVDELVERLRSLTGSGDGPATPSPGGPPEAALVDHLERFRAVFDQAAIGMATLTLTGRIVRANPALERLVGAEREALVGTAYRTLAGSSDVDDAVVLVASAERDVATAEHPLGDRIVVTTLVGVRDSHDTPLYLFLQVQDITELRRSEERFRLLVEGVQDYAIFMLDPTGHIVSWNLGAERAKGYRAEEILGRHFSTFYLQEAIDSGHPEYELEVAAAEGRYEEEGWRKRKDGTTFWANVVITAIRKADGELLGFAKVTRDVTERKEMLEALAASADERIQLLAVTAHELRNPVALVNGFASTLRDHWQDFSDAERAEMLDSVVRSGERLGRLVDDLFTAARLESGALEIRATRFDMTALVEEVARDVDPAVSVEGASMPALADRSRVQQMVHNYLTNAMRHGAGPVRVSVGDDGSGVRVAVSDSGTGVPAELQPRLFSKFMRGGSREGAGLGLFIVRELARAQGGDAWYEDASGGGACFAFRVPRANGGADG